MVFNKSRLENVKRIALGKVFHRPNFEALSLVRKHQARSNGRTIDKYRAGATDTVFATNVGARKTAILPDRIRQRLAMFHLDVVYGSVHA